MELSTIAKEARSNALAKGFTDPVEIGTWLMLITSELGEALDAHREGKFNLTDAEKTHIELLIVTGRFDEFKKYKEYFGFEVADALIRILEGAEARQMDLEWYVKMKMEYNKSREQKHGGKAY